MKEREEVLAMDGDVVTEILKKLKSGNTATINTGLKLLDGLNHRSIKEQFGKREGNAARRGLFKLIDKLLILMKDADWRTRYAAVRGVRIIGFNSDLGGRVEEIVERLLERLLRDSDGRVRNAAVHALNWIRTLFSEDLYVELYLLLQNLYDEETDKKKRRSIDQALNALWCPYLESLLLSKGFVPVGGVAS